MFDFDVVTGPAGPVAPAKAESPQPRPETVPPKEPPSRHQSLHPVNDGSDASP